MKTIYIVLCFLVLPLCNYGQSFLDLEGTWQMKVDDASFCNIIMMEDGENGEPLVVLEGMSNEEPFQIRCRVEHLVQRQSIALYELADEKGAKKYDSDRPIVCFILKTGGSIAPLWCQMDMAEAESKNKTFQVEKVTIPDYKKRYQFVPYEASTATVMK